MKTTIKQLFAFLLLALFSASVCFAQTSSSKSKTPNSSGYHLLKKIKIGGEGGWDYIFNDSKVHIFRLSLQTTMLAEEFTEQI